MRTDAFNKKKAIDVIEGAQDKRRVEYPEAFGYWVANVKNLRARPEVLAEPLSQISDEKVPCSKDDIVHLNRACKIQSVDQDSQRDDWECHKDASYQEWHQRALI